MADYLIRVVDLETVGFLDEQIEGVRQNPKFGIVEIGWTDVTFNVRPDNTVGAITVADRYGTLLFNPPNGIPPESMGVHHITPKMVANCKPCDDSAIRALAKSPGMVGEPFALCAHNIEFEREWLDQYLPADTRWICTLKVAAQLNPDWKSHANHSCRYHLGLELDERADPPHRAGPDSFVTAHVLAKFLASTSVRQMMAWTREPRLLTTCPLGAHRNKPWCDVPEDFLRWMVGPKPDKMDADAKHWAQVELEKRARMKADPDLATAGY